MGRLTIAAAAVVVALAGVAGAAAGQRTREIFTFSDPFSGSFDCGTFAASAASDCFASVHWRSLSISIASRSAVRSSITGAG